MCTCGIDIATQHARPATQRIACSAPGESPSGRAEACVPRVVTPDAAIAGGRRRKREGERKHRHDAEDADPDERLTPPEELEEVLEHRWPDGTCQVVSAGADRNCDAAAAGEPQRSVGDQRHEQGRAPEKADQQPLGDAELQQVLRPPRGDEADSECHGADQHRNDHAVTVGEASHQDAAEAEADHRQRVG